MKLTIHKIRFSDKQAEYLTALGLKERFGVDFYRTCGFVRSDLLALLEIVPPPPKPCSDQRVVTNKAIRRKIAAALETNNNTAGVEKNE